MNYSTVLEKAMAAPAFHSQDLTASGKLRPHESVQLNRWIRQKRLVRLRRGFYALADYKIRPELSPLWLANRLCWPSYISLEHAMSHFGLIPEAANAITCATTLKTQKFNNDFGTFTYRKVMPAYFFGFKNLKTQSGLSYWMAQPEKALLDFIYLSIPKGAKMTKELFLDGYRLQNLEQIRHGVLKNFIGRFTNPRVQEGGRVILQIIGKAGGRHD